MCNCLSEYIPIIKEQAELVTKMTIHFIDLGERKLSWNKSILCYDGSQ